jgi:hypothetical protein
MNKQKELKDCRNCYHFDRCTLVSEIIKLLGRYSHWFPKNKSESYLYDSISEIIGSVCKLRENSGIT